MKIEIKTVTIRELVKNYQNNEDEGVQGYNGKLDIRPPYQREFIYDDKKKVAVIDTIMKGYPLNVMYWAVNGQDTFEVIDGQQRTMSICEYVNNEFSFNDLQFNNLTQDKKDTILNYELMIYFCEGKESEKLEWFKTINIAGEKLTTQELHNAVYSGSWVTSAKKMFSKRSCDAQDIGSDYIKGSPIRQDYLKTAIKWIADITNDDIVGYMAKHQHKANANELWSYYQNVMTWVKMTFPTIRKKFMRSVEWGILYNKYGQQDFDVDEMEEKIQKLIMDDDVKNKSGIYPYLLTGKDKYLSLRTFSDSLKQKMYEKQKGVCSKCDNHFTLSQMEADHIIPWSKGGATVESNGQMLCIDCNRAKSDH